MYKALCPVNLLYPSNSNNQFYIYMHGRLTIIDHEQDRCILWDNHRIYSFLYCHYFAEISTRDTCGIFQMFISMHGNWVSTPFYSLYLPIGLMIELLEFSMWSGSFYWLVSFRQMGSNYKAALIPQRIRETIHGWGKAARKRRKHRRSIDDSTIHTETSTVCSIEEDEELLDDPSDNSYVRIELQPRSTTNTTVIDSDHSTIGNGHSNYSGAEAPLLQSVSVPSSPTLSGLQGNGISRSASMPIWRGWVAYRDVNVYVV